MKKIPIVAAVAVAMCLSAVAAERWNMFERRLGMFVHWGIYSVGGWHEQEEMRRGMCRAEYEKCAGRFMAEKVTLLNTGKALKADVGLMPSNALSHGRETLHVGGIPADELANECIVLRLDFAPDVFKDLVKGN